MLSDKILRRLLTLHPKSIDLSLERLQRLLARLGNPERQLPPAVHIAGTNGKGSVTAYVSAALEHDGCRVHVYSSPHLVRFHERIRLASATGGAFVDEDMLSSALEECEQANNGSPITFFEITTAAAFLLFSRRPADYLVLEVGLGGRLDATNLVSSLAACVITPISFDHMQFLGNSLTEIAGEKAGILKPGVSCVVARQHPEALAAVGARADEIDAPLLVQDRDWMAFEQQGRLIFQDKSGLLDLPLPRLAGRHQRDNAGVAIAALRLLSAPPISVSAMEHGLAGAEWPARLQSITSGRLRALLPDDAELWLDGGHNAAAGVVLAQSMADFDERHSRPLVLITGMLAQKDPDGFLSPFVGLARHVICVPIPDEENSLSADQLAQRACALGFSTRIADSVAAALRIAGANHSCARVLICGSLYLAGHVLASNE